MSFGHAFSLLDTLNQSQPAAVAQSSLLARAGVLTRLAPGESSAIFFIPAEADATPTDRKIYIANGVGMIIVSVSSEETKMYPFDTTAVDTDGQLIDRPGKEVALPADSFFAIRASNDNPEGLVFTQPLVEDGAQIVPDDRISVDLPAGREAVMSYGFLALTSE